MKKQGVLTVISGFSGVGKGTIVKELLKQYPDEFALSISATTRKPREGETDGKEYFFVSRKEFETMIHKRMLFEHAEYNGNYYGTPKKYVKEQLKAGKNVILEIECQGAVQIKEQFPKAYLLFVIPPSAKILYERLVGRNTETMEQIRGRMKRAISECDYLPKYDAVLENNVLFEAVKEAYRMITTASPGVVDIEEKLPVLKTELTELQEE